MPNRWVEHVKSFAAKNNLSYGCALSKPECKETYRAKYGVAKKLTKKKNIEKMGAEDFDAPSMKPKKGKKDLVIIEEPKPEPKKKIKVKKVTIEGTMYYMDENNILYDIEDKEPIGVWDRDTKIIEDLPDSFYEDEED